MSSRNNTPKTSSGKKPIEKIVVCGSSYSRPGQSGIDKIWSHYLEEKLEIPVVNLTWKSGSSNSEILRSISEYIWENDTSGTAFIVQWTTIDRLEFCHDEKEWYQIRQTHLKTGEEISKEIFLKQEKLMKASAYTYSASTYMWQFFQQILTLDFTMRQNLCPYFQVYVTESILHDLFTKNQKFYFTKFTNQIYKMLNSCRWYDNNIIKADLTSKGYPIISKDDVHWNKKGHQQVAKNFYDYITKEEWS